MLENGSRYPIRGMRGLTGHKVIGKQSVEVYFGHYHTITRIYVSAFFAFDENGELIDIVIRREYDLI